MELKRAKVIMLPTTNNSDLYKSKTGHAIKTRKDLFTNENWHAVHLYFVTDDGIEKDDWVTYDVAGYNNPDYNSHFIGKVTSTREVGQANCHYDIDGRQLGKTLGWHCEDCRKIIATTDSSLNVFKTMAVDGKIVAGSNGKLPQPHQMFIDKYVRKGGINEVMVEYHTIMCADSFDMDTYPGNLKVDSDNTITIHSVKDSWSKEEVIILLNKCHGEQISEWGINEWIKNNLK